MDTALDDGVPLKGCLFWTGVDNYEWLHGFDVSFGLFDRDRGARPTAAYVSSVAQREFTVPG